MSSQPDEHAQSSGLGFLAYMAVALVVLIAAFAIWTWTRSGPQEPTRPMPSAGRALAAVTPVALSRAAERIPALDDAVARFTYDDSPKSDGTLPPGQWASVPYRRTVPCRYTNRYRTSRRSFIPPLAELLVQLVTDNQQAL